MRERPADSKSSDKILLAASVGWNPSQKTYPLAFLHVPADSALHNIDVSTNPVPQHAFLASKKPAIIRIQRDYYFKQFVYFVFHVQISSMQATCTVVSRVSDKIKKRLIDIQNHKIKAR